MDVSARSTVDVEHIGGPYDGYIMPVPVDDAGLPPEYYTVDRCGPVDFSMDPGSGPVSQIGTDFYDLDVRMGDDGPRYVFIHRGETYTDAAA